MNKLEIIYQVTGQPKGKIQGSDLTFAAVVEFNSLQDAMIVTIAKNTGIFK